MVRYEKLRLWVDSDIPEGVESMEWDDLTEYLTEKVENWGRMTEDSKQAILDSFRIMWLERMNDFDADDATTIPDDYLDEINMLLDRYDNLSLEQRIKRIEEQVEAGDFETPLQKLIDEIRDSLDEGDDLEGDEEVRKWIDDLDELL